MKQRILVLAMSGLLATLVGCSSAPTTTSSTGTGTGAGTPIGDQRLAASEFRKEGVKIIYSLNGQLEAIEVTGYAATWGSSTNASREAYRVAELEAKKSLNDFINKETIVTKTSVVMISENLENAEDSTSNKSSNKPTAKQGNTGTAEDLVAADDDAAVKAAQEDGNTNENTTTRNNALKIASKLRTTITNSNQGILSGLYLKEGAVIDDGKAVKVVMRWDKKHNASRLEIGKLMAM